ncbi:MAG: TonB-dependent receptor, partial [Burkholderiales bacterium]
PELVLGLEYRKGPYYAEKGDFSAAGAVDLSYAAALPAGIASLGLGEDDFQRALVADTPRLGAGNLLYALEYLHNDGPWKNPDDFRKINAALGYNFGSGGDGFSVLALAYDSRGDATNQIARRAVRSGLIDRFDSLDKSDGSDSSRYSVSGTWRMSGANSATTASAYVIKSELDLFSNFTYFLDDPVNGDQFLQTDERVTSGFDLSHLRIANWGGRTFENTFGVQFQNDNISNGLFKTRNRQLLSVTREDEIVETSAGAYASTRIHWAEKFHTIVGVRGDFFHTDVDSDNPVNSGTARASLVNPKLSLIFGPYAETEYFVNGGGGFHSNDARGATITIDPATGDPADRVPLLVRAKGYEVGLRSIGIQNLVTTFAVYLLDFDSELVFVGDAGTTEASRPSRRTGFELSALYKPLSWRTVDADIAYARARFRDDDPAGDRIPGAVEGVATLSAVVDSLGPWFGALQLRYFGPRPLIEDNSVRSSSTTLVAGRVGYKSTRSCEWKASICSMWKTVR